MQMIGKTRTVPFLFSTMFLALLACSGLGTAAHAQTVPPGVQNRPGATPACAGVDANGMPVSPNDTSCGPFAPGFVAPSTNVPHTEPPPQTVLAVVRVETRVEKPEKTPFPMDFTRIGTATMVKAKVPRLYVCYAAGKILSTRSGAATSTTCLDEKGEVLAYQECTPKIGDTPMACKSVAPGAADGGTVASAKP